MGLDLRVLVEAQPADRSLGAGRESHANGRFSRAQRQVALVASDQLEPAEGVAGQQSPVILLNGDLRLKPGIVVAEIRQR
jgi:hypothetical protein